MLRRSLPIDYAGVICHEWPSRVSKASRISSARRNAAAALCCASCSRVRRSPASPTSSSRRCGRLVSRASRASTSRTPECADIAERLAPDRSRRARSEPGEFEGWFPYVLQRGTTPNGVFGAKMMWNYFDDFRARIAELPGLERLRSTRRSTRSFPDLRIIFVRRRDKVSQAVSLWKAIQTQQWRTESEVGETSWTAIHPARGRVRLPGARATSSTSCTGGTPAGRTGSTPRVVIPSG